MYSKRPLKFLSGQSIVSEVLFEFLDNFNIGRQPIDGVKFVAGEPLHGFMLDQFDLALRDARQEAVHREVEIRVVVVLSLIHI